MDKQGADALDGDQGWLGGGVLLLRCCPCRRFEAADQETGECPRRSSAAVIGRPAPQCRPGRTYCRPRRWPRRSPSRAGRRRPRVAPSRSSSRCEPAAGEEPGAVRAVGDDSLQVAVRLVPRFGFRRAEIGRTETLKRVTREARPSGRLDPGCGVGERLAPEQVDVGVLRPDVTAAPEAPPKKIGIERRCSGMSERCLHW